MHDHREGEDGSDFVELLHPHISRRPVQSQKQKLVESVSETQHGSAEDIQERHAGSVHQRAEDRA